MSTDPVAGLGRPEDRLYTDIGETVRSWSSRLPFTESGNSPREPVTRDLRSGTGTTARERPEGDGRMHQAGGICWCRANHGWEAAEMNRYRGPWDQRDDAYRSTREGSR